MGIVTCGLCSQKFNRAAEGSEFIKGKWYHKNCAIIKKDKIKLDEYICKIFQLKAVGPVNNKMIKEFVDKRGYTYNGIYKALQYYYEVRKHSADKAEERIGIVPFVYNDAQDYYNMIDSFIDKRGRSAIAEKPKEIEINIHTPEKIKVKPTQATNDDLDNLFDEE